ncbi:MAG: membrane dipeptidase [Bacteroidota bacterium]
MPAEKNNYIDFHCHPALKPFGKSFNYKTIGKNHKNRRRLSSIWRYDPPSLLDKLLNYIGNLTKFSQSNFTSLAKGGVSVICASLYPLEKGFFDNKIEPEFLKDLLSNFTSGVGKKRVDAIQKITNYYKDLELEYDFYLQLNNVGFTLPEGRFKYRIVRNYQDIKAVITAAENEKTTISTICVVMSIEGLHVLNNDTTKPPIEQEFLNNLKFIKSWATTPFFVAIAHHFWNHLCGHAESFTGIVKRNVDQSNGLGLGFTALGIKVVHELLNDQNGRRILIDVKHMSVKARQQYYELLYDNPDYANVPIIVSHGAANGMVSFENRSQSGSTVAEKLMAANINIFNSEIILIAKSKGILGLQLDERRVVNEKTLKATKNSMSRSKIMHYRSGLLWFQIQHIAEVLDNEGLFAWDCIVIGSDFDGIVDPLNSFWTAEELPYLADFLERHAFNYLINKSFNNQDNNIKADEVISRIMSTNGLAFLEANF